MRCDFGSCDLCSYTSYISYKMQLRSNTVGATVEFHPEMLFFLCFALLLLCILVSKCIIDGHDPTVIIYATPRLNAQTNGPTDAAEDGEVIQIRIEFSPKAAAVRRSRALSTLDLGPAATNCVTGNAAEPKKEV